ncbi:MAG: transposase [Legionellales bacterium]|nr:transposase [Legionellales bacterium]
MSKKRYEKSFKQEAVNLALRSEKAIAQVARDLGIKESLLYSWTNQARQGQDEISTSLVNKEDLVSELLSAKKEIARLKEEREILKKAAKFFINEQK